MTKVKVNLHGVNETMMVPLYARVLESKKKKPAFYDQVAVRTIDSLDYDFEKHGNKINMCVLRARLFWIQERVHLSKSIQLGQPLTSLVDSCDCGGVFNVPERGGDRLAFR